jgi:hypothetical protein
MHDTESEPLINERIERDELIVIASINDIDLPTFSPPNNEAPEPILE